jgi:hypothetical protein
MAGFGLNPRFGYDSRAPYLQGGEAYGYGYVPPPGYDAFIPQAPPRYVWVDIGGAAAIPLQPSPYGIPPAPPFMQQWNQYAQCGHNGGMGMGYNGAVPDGGFPGTNFHNIFGGIGMEPGYNYIYPESHCKIHVLISARPPWENAGPPPEKRHFNVPTGITVKELMQQFGCTNPDPAKNQLIEITQGSDGSWYRGITLKGSDKKQMDKRIEEVGWNSRRGKDQDFVWLYFTKD